ncbi:MAG: hypothetical protein ACKVU4_06985 [Phycisphaerales bacterium]
MPVPIPVPDGAIERAETLYRRLESWRRTDEALGALRAVSGFSPAVTLLKVAAVNALYYTNVYAIVRVAEHFASVLTAGPLGDLALVERLAAVPRGGAEKRAVRRLSLASKFAHFFVDEEVFPIYDQYAVRMVAKHTGVSVLSLDGRYAAFAEAFGALARDAGLMGQRRRLDRYLWVQGQYEEWREKGTTSSRDLIEVFKKGEWPVARGVE